ncbi:hypothetical protein FRC03_007128 [Tulasnella sp. 419]|nr:hypothetical protein FRC03_007128 [Tulasnella sp. 419]
MLQRSKSAPLHIFCSCKNKTKAEKFFDLLNPLSARWRSLEFNYNNIDRLSLDFLAGRSFPLLEQLTLPDIAGRSRSIVFNAFNLDIIAPSIKLLQAPEYPLALRLDQGIHTRLTSLCFTASIDSTTFLPTDYYTLLSSTPYLQHLVIKGFRNADAPDPAVTTPLRIDLPYLELLSLRSLRYKTIGFLLSSIVKPQNNCHRVNVGGNPCGSLFTMFSLSPLAEDSLLAEMCHPIEATLLSLGASFGVHTNAGLRDDGKHLLSLISSDLSDSPAEDLSTIMTMLFSSIRKLEIDGLELMLHGLGGKFHLLPRLEEIKFHSDEQDDYQECQDALEQIITVMASRSPPGQSSQAICPLLRHIVLDTFHFDLNRLVELVLVRTDMDGESKDKGRLELVELGDEFDLEDPTMQLLHDLSTTRNFDLRVGVLSEW